jgi:hypothetical protein
MRREPCHQRAAGGCCRKAGAIIETRHLDLRIAIGNDDHALAPQGEHAPKATKPQERKAVEHQCGAEVGNLGLLVARLPRLFGQELLHTGAAKPEPFDPIADLARSESEIKKLCAMARLQLLQHVRCERGFARPVAAHNRDQRPHRFLPLSYDPPFPSCYRSTTDMGCGPWVSNTGAP